MKLENTGVVLITSVSRLSKILFASRILKLTILTTNMSIAALSLYHTSMLQSDQKVNVVFEFVDT